MSATKPHPTQTEIKKYLKYDPSTGEFTWTKSRRGRKVGDKAGSLRKDYIRIKLKGEEYAAHRLAFCYMTAIYPPEVDHYNQVKTDNTWDNLRASVRKLNAKNTPIQCNTTSGCMGVSRCGNSWIAQIYNNSKKIYLGIFKDKQDAINARKEAEIKYGYHKNHNT